MTPMIYAGIGSRSTPLWALATMTVTAEVLARTGCTLRSGGANGADTAFEEGCDIGKGVKEIYLPWRGFNYRITGTTKHASDVYLIPPVAFELAAKFHPARWTDLKEGVQKLMARNAQQVLGRDLDTPAHFILCFTPLGSGSGGTGQAIRMAKAYDIPVFDMGKFEKSTVAVPLMDFLRSYHVL